MKGGNPKVRIWDDVVTYCDSESLLKYTYITQYGPSTQQFIQFQCVNINFPLNLPMSDTSSQILTAGAYRITGTVLYVCRHKFQKPKYTKMQKCGLCVVCTGML